MSAREDYPLLAWIDLFGKTKPARLCLSPTTGRHEGSAPWPEGRSAGQDPSIAESVTGVLDSIAESVTGVLDHVDALRSVVEAAIVWRQCERAMHGNTSEASRRHHDAVWTAKRRLHERLDELLVEGAAGRGAP